MNLRQWLPLRLRAGRTTRRTRMQTRTRPALEALESRLVLYSVSGNAWPNPAAITLSFAPDGTNLGGVSSNLFSTFNNNPKLAGQWQAQILKAAQSYAQQTNINLVVVPDNGAPSGSGNDQQGDPGYGDIRIGGYAFGNSSLARTYEPPPINNFSIAGDVAFNTAQNFSIGSSGYDLFTVAAHEFGHALGLNHTSATASAELYPSYNGVKSTFNADDIAGIRNIYSGNNPRTADVYDAQGQGNSFATAANLNSQWGPSTQALLVNNLDITTTSDLDYYTFTAPANSSGSLTVSVQSGGLSMLSPKLTIYAADQKSVLATVNGQNQDGTTLTATLKGAGSGTTYYALVQGADSTPFSTGRYALVVNVGTGASPTVPSSIVPIANGNPISGGGGAAEGGGEFDDILDAVPVVAGISNDTGLSTNDGVTNDPTLYINGQAPELNTVQVYNNGQLVGRTLVLLGDSWSLNATSTRLADGTYNFTATSTDLLGNVSPMSAPFTVVVDTMAPVAPTIGGYTAGTAAGGNTPTFDGTAAPNTLVTVSSNGQAVGSVMADSSGNWSCTTSPPASGTDQITATATDLAGNVSSPSKGLTIQVAATATATTTASPPPAAPSIRLVNLVSSLLGLVGSLLGMPTLGGTAGAGSIVTILDGDTILGTTTAGSTGAWTFTSPTLAKGKHSISASATTLIGITSPLSTALTLTI